jgi:chemotaxis protein methyltransferase WspC
LYALQGVIHQARQEKEQALGCFRKALYLDPNHCEALTHLMLLCRQEGDDASAALLRRRLERTSTGGKS